MNLIILYEDYTQNTYTLKTIYRSGKNIIHHYLVYLRKTHYVILCLISPFEVVTELIIKFFYKYLNLRGNIAKKI